MGAPNIQQQLYLKTALNESKDGMFDHPADLDEATKGSHKNVMRLDKAFRKSFDKNPKSAETERLAGAASLADKKLDAKELRRGGASERTMRRRINQDKWSEGWGAKNRFAREGQKKRRAALKAKGIAEALQQKLDEGYQAKRLRIFRKANKNEFAKFAPGTEDFMKRSFKRKVTRDNTISGGKGSVRALDIRRRKKTAAMKEKGLMEGSRGTQKLKRIMKSVTKNYRQGKAMIGTRNKDVAMRELVSPESPTAKATRAALNAGVDHMQKKAALRRQISSRTRAAAMRERGRAGLSPKLPKGSGMMPKNETGGYEYTENPKRVPSAVKTYRKSSAVKRNMYR